MTAADAVLVASGTATLEAALLKRPMAIVYKMAPLSYRMMRRMGYLPYVGLPNVLAGRFVVPEFIQDEATPENLAQALLNLYADKAACERIKAVFTDIHRQLRQNAAEKAAVAIIACLPRYCAAMPSCCRLRVSSAASTRLAAGRWRGRWSPPQ
jgi:lipid-A-disaccharide synthase